MDFVSRLSLWWIFFGYLCFAASGAGAEADQKNITAESGQNVTLPCRDPNYNKENFQWNRTDLGEEEYVFLYRDEKFVLENQHPSFQNRVDLQDRQMKDGNLSVILKNVTTADNGAYECRVRLDETWKLLRSINLSVVVPPGPTGEHTEDGSAGLIVGLPVGVIVAAVVGGGGVLIYRKFKSQNRGSCLLSNFSLFERFCHLI